MTINGEYVRILKQVFVAYFKILYRLSLGHAEENSMSLRAN
jgi:hypothetical protein